MKKIITFLIVLIICFATPLMAEEQYKFSMLPRYFPKRIMGMINPLAEYLSKEKGLTVKAVLTKDFAEYENRLKNGEIEIGYENPLVYVKVSKAHEVLVMAVKGDGGDKFRGIIITRPDSGIESIKDLRHKKIMIVGETSAGGYLSQKMTLSNNGVDVEKDCEIGVAADNKQENVIISVSIGDVDAGFIRESAFHAGDKYIQPGSIKTLAHCAWLPNWAFSVKRSIPETKKRAIKNALLGLKKGSPVLKAIGLNGFCPTDDSRYDIMRKLLGIAATSG